jgi:[ribosomal protein S18]-alanine N-acetyltransferase
VPGYAYDDSALDTGGGLRPALTGRGLGREAIATGLAYGQQRFTPRAFRVTVASFNARAQRVVTSLGFEHLARFEASTDGRPYDVFVRVG